MATGYNYFTKPGKRLSSKRFFTKQKNVTATMLENWILKIREDTETYLSHTWRYQISGNSIELSVLRPYLKNKETYRSAVIAIGRVLKALSRKIEKSSAQFLIQSFPSIDHHEVVASIRMDENSTAENSIKSLPKTAKKEGYQEMLNRVTEFYQLKIEQAEPALMRAFGIDTHKYQKKNWQLVTSKTDNPFTWLNVGFWQESITKRSSEKPAFITNFSRKTDGEIKNESATPQVLIAFN